MGVRAKKHLGQHFLKDPSVSKRISDAIPKHLAPSILEVGPGTGALTQFLVEREENLFLSEIDRDSVKYLEEHYPNEAFTLVPISFLDANWPEILKSDFIVAGNFPYNISSQIVFKALDMRDMVPALVGMFQKELAERICAGPGSKTYGVISVLSQAYYDCEYLFTVDEQVFVPPPKVKSGVLKMTRHDRPLGCNASRLKQVVKATFNQRRKTIRNGLKSLGLEVPENEFLGLRPEQMSLENFVSLTKILYPTET